MQQLFLQQHSLWRDKSFHMVGIITFIEIHFVLFWSWSIDFLWIKIHSFKEEQDSLWKWRKFAMEQQRAQYSINEELSCFFLKSQKPLMLWAIAIWHGAHFLCFGNCLARKQSQKVNPGSLRPKCISKSCTSLVSLRRMDGMCWMTILCIR